MATVLTINEAMVTQKMLRGRLGALSSLRSQCATKDVYYGGGERERTVEPQYDIKDLDKRCVEIENAMHDIEAKIKQSNALTKINIDCDVKELMEPLS